MHGSLNAKSFMLSCEQQNESYQHLLS